SLALARAQLTHPGPDQVGHRPGRAVLVTSHEVGSVPTSRKAVAVASAARAASAPLSSPDPGRPARSSACSSVSQVSTPKPTGTPVVMATWVSPQVAAWHT